jgi:hypothetical protein
MEIVMGNKISKAKRELHFSFKVKSIKKHKSVFNLPCIEIENFLYNIYGLPRIELVKCNRKENEWYWNYNKNGVWMRYDHTYSFLTKELKELAKSYITDEYIIIDL